MPLQDSFDFGWVHPALPVAHKMAKVFGMLITKVAFGPLRVQFLLTQALKDHAEVPFMLISTIAIH